MLIQITDKTDGQYAKSIELTDGKNALYVSVAKSDGRVNVLCQNASHRVWRGAGRFFPSFAAAIAGYKSASVRSLIQAAEAELTEPAADAGFANAAAVTLAHHIWFQSLENWGKALAHENELPWFIHCHFNSASAIQAELAKAGIVEPKAAFAHFERLRTAKAA